MRSKKTSYHHPGLRQDLVQAAIKFLKNNRAEDLSLRSLAREMGVSHMAPYRHFKTKEDLLGAVIEDGFKRMSQDFEIQVNSQIGKEKFKDLLMASGISYVRFVQKNPDQARLMFSGLLCDPKKHKEAHIAGQEAFGKLLQLIEYGQSIGELKKDNPFQMGLLLWSAVHGTAMLMIENQFSMIEGAPKVDLEKHMEYLTTKMLKGLNQ